MKKILVSLIFFTLAVISKAQKTGSSSRRYQYQNVRVKAMVLDAKSSQPIPYVTVYLIPQGDTTITNFSVSTAWRKVRRVLMPHPSRQQEIPSPSRRIRSSTTLLRSVSVKMPCWKTC